MKSDGVVDHAHRVAPFSHPAIWLLHLPAKIMDVAIDFFLKKDEFLSCIFFHQVGNPLGLPVSDDGTSRANMNQEL